MTAWLRPETVRFVAANVSRRTGFTVDPDTTPVRATRLKGYAIAAGGYVEVIRDGTGSATCIRVALRELEFWRTALMFDGPPLLLSGWFDAEAGEYLLALTAVMCCPLEARRLAREQNQRFVYSFTHDRDVAVADLPLSCPLRNAR